MAVGKSLSKWKYWCLALFLTAVMNIQISAQPGKDVVLNNEVIVNGVKVSEEIRKNRAMVGDVKFSILKEADFQALYGPDWVLMDGRGLGAGDPLHVMYNFEEVPDARGRFFRMQDHGKGEDPEGNRDPGSLQADSTKMDGVSLQATNADLSHSHDDNTGNRGSHSHSGTTGGSTELVLKSGGGFQTETNTNYQENAWSAGHTHGFSTNTAPGHTHPISLDLGSHSHSITANGAAETRPKNIIINAFVKVR